MRSKLFAVMSGLILSALLPLTSMAQTPKQIKIGYLSFYGTVQAHELADELGYFKGTGVEIQPKGYVTGGPETLMAMAAGDIQVSIVATSAMLNAISGGYDLVATYPSQGMSGDVVSKFYVLENSPIKDIKDLAGKTIAVNTLGAHLDFVIREALRKAGVPQKSVKLISVPNPQLEQVLRSGQADVVAVGYWVNQFQGAIEKNGGVRTLFRDLDVIGELSGGFALMRRDFVDAHPDIVKQFTIQSARALDYSREHLDETRKLMGKILERRGENAEVAKYFLGYGVRPGGLGTFEDVQYWKDVMTREKLIDPGKIDIRKIMYMMADDANKGKK